MYVKKKKKKPSTDMYVIAMYPTHCHRLASYKSSLKESKLVVNIAS